MEVRQGRRGWVAAGAAVFGLMLLTAAFSLGVYLGRYGPTGEGLRYAGRGPGGPAGPPNPPQGGGQPGGPPGLPPGLEEPPQLIGRLLRIAPDGLELATPDGPRLVRVPAEARFEDTGGEALAASDLKPGMIVAIYGQLSDQGQSLVAERVVLVQPPAPAPTASPVSQTAAPLSVRLVKQVPVTTDAEGGSARPEIVATATRAFVLYLGNIGEGGRRTFSLKVYDADLENLIASRVLVETTSDYGGPTDIRVASDGQFAYAFYETHRPTSRTSATTYLWGAKYVLDDDFERVAQAPEPIASSQPMAELQDGGELLDDPAPLIGPEGVFVVTRLKSSLSPSGRTVYRVRQFNKEDLSLRSEFDLDLSEVADGRARVASLLFWNDGILMALPSTAADEGINESVDDGAPSDILLVRMQPDWTFDPNRDVRTIAAEPGDRENYVTGLETDGSHLFVTYKQSTGRPPTGEHVAWIRVFDRDLNLIHAERAKSTLWGPGGGELRPSLEIFGSRLYSGQSGGQGIGRGNAEIWVYALDTN